MFDLRLIFILFQGLTGGSDINIESHWAALASAFRDIHTKNMSSLSFEHNYRLAYQLVLKKHGELLYGRVKTFEEEWLTTQVRGKLKTLISSKLLNNDEAAGNVSVHEKRLAGERFLKGMKVAWEDHNVCMNMFTDLLMYMVGLPCPPSYLQVANESTS